jgi:hypothetical protein
LAAIYGLAQVVTEVIPGNDLVYTPVFAATEGVLFLCVLGVLYDWSTLKVAGADWRHLLDLYRARQVRFSLAYLAPVLVATILLVEQIVVGHLGSGFNEFVKSTPSLLAPPPR